MISRLNGRRLRRIFAPAADLRNAILISILGVLIFATGVALSFKIVILPMLEVLSEIADVPFRAIVAPENRDVARHFFGGALLMLGFYVAYAGVRQTIRHVVQTINPTARQGMADMYLRRQQLAHGPRVVALGGGTGLSTLLRGLKHHTSNITAIVTVTDDGGSSGTLVKETGIIPPGDIRNCLVALADAETSMTSLFQHRFKKDAGALSGHAVGNLLIYALTDQAGGDMERAVQMASEVLAIRGRVLPSTLSHVKLCADFDDGTRQCGETAIVELAKPIRRIYLDPPDCAPHPEAIAAIQNADLICIGPGSVYTSVIPNLLVPGMAEAIRDSKAMKVYICNVMTQRGESDHFSASQHVEAIQANLDFNVFDHVLVNVGSPPPEIVQRYADSGQELVHPDIDRIQAMGLRVIAGDLVSESDLVRHDPMKAASQVLKLVHR